MRTIHLKQGLILKEASTEETQEIMKIHFKELFANRLSLPRETNLNIPTERLAHFNSFKKSFVLYKNEVPVGWHIGHAQDEMTYYMQNSAIIKSEQGQNLYGEMLKGVMEILNDEGYQVLRSLHHPNNPAVLIPKLKLGFVISGTQFSENFRGLIEMKYFFNEGMKKSFDQSVGLVF